MIERQLCWLCRQSVKTTRRTYAPELMAVFHAKCLWAAKWCSKVYRRPSVRAGLKFQIIREWEKQQDVS